jgi:4-hydroxy-tetrahydrodipicolinate reductase
MTSITLFGASGRMGRAIAELAAERDDVTVSGQDTDVYVDFSAPEALEANVRQAVEAGKPLLIGTTGLDASHGRLIDDAAHSIPILQAANTSMGVAVLTHLVEQAARLLGPGWDIQIAEMHHRNKADAPSGTALHLGKAAARGRSDQEGRIGFASLRGGTVAGDHLVVLAGEGERLELGHRAESRTLFARGAIEAALWLVGKPPGRYTMADVLGLA